MLLCQIFALALLHSCTLERTFVGVIKTMNYGRIIIRSNHHETGVPCG